MGIIYTKFHEKVGPLAFSWYPLDLPGKVRNIISIKSLSVLTGETGEVPKSLLIIPFQSINMKGLIKFLTVSDVKYRGGSNDRTLSVLFGESNDLIYYKYLTHFEPLFEATAQRILELEDDEEKIQKELEIFYAQMNDTLLELCKSELSDQEEVPFPIKSESVTESLSYRFKVIFCGDEQVGKTSIVLRFTDKAFRRTYIPTIGVNISEKKFQSENIIVEFIIWDIAGKSKFNKMRKHYYHGADAAIFVFDLTNPLSFQHIQDWFNDVTYYLGLDIQGILIGNKSDLINERTVFGEDILKLAKELNLQYIQTSALTGENVVAVFSNLGRILTKEKKI